MRRFLWLRNRPDQAFVLFGIPAALTAMIFVFAMIVGKINVSDTADYLKHSRSIFDGVLAAGYPFDYALYRPPFFGAVIALAGEISENYQVHVAITVNLIVALIALWIIFNSRLPNLSIVGKIALVILIFSNVWFFREIFTLRETAWYTLFCAMFVLVCQRMYASTWLGVCMGIVCGLAMLTRPTGIVLLIASIILLLSFYLTKMISAKRLVLVIGTLIIITAGMILPWQFYIQTKFDRFQITSSCSGGFTLFKGNHPIMGNLEPSIDLDAADSFVWDYAARHLRDPSQAASLCARSDFLGSQVIASLRENPLRFLKSLPASLSYILAPMPIPLGGGDISFDAASQQLKITSFHPRPFTSFVSVFYYAGLYVAALAGAFLIRRKADDLLWAGPVFLLILGHVAIYAGTLAEIRFRMPFEPLLCVMAAKAVQRFAVHRSVGT